MDKKLSQNRKVKKTEVQKKMLAYILSLIKTKLNKT